MKKSKVKLDDETRWFYAALAHSYMKDLYALEKGNNGKKGNSKKCLF